MTPSIKSDSDSAWLRKPFEPPTPRVATDSLSSVSYDISSSHTDRNTMEAALRCLGYRKSRGTELVYLEMVYRLCYNVPRCGESLVEANCVVREYLPKLQVVVAGAVVFVDEYGHRLPVDSDSDTESTTSSDLETTPT